MDISGCSGQAADLAEKIIRQVHQLQIKEQERLREAAAQLGAALGQGAVDLVAGV
jgi:hypothetical protein